MFTRDNTPQMMCTTRKSQVMLDTKFIDVRREKHRSHFANPACPGRAASLMIARACRHRCCLLRHKSRDVWTGSLPCSSPDTILDQLSLMVAVMRFVYAFACRWLSVCFAVAAARSAVSLIKMTRVRHRFRQAQPLDIDGIMKLALTVIEVELWGVFCWHFHSLSPLSISCRCAYKGLRVLKRARLQSLVHSRVVFRNFIKAPEVRVNRLLTPLPRLPGGKHYVRQA